ncbi:alpha/beta hydrolase [Enterobacter sp. Bisph1]|uniref:alpha/beta fold hydrolase n=1 Tax=Enterobacter sp. Bisph1 TaxID=1274399 RepID=UPI00057C20F6|nr:alpha/beta hydrolase [Enterobacter sp. Bisph1]
MQSFYSLHARGRVRWHWLPGKGDPVVFIHGLGCASSFDYPRIVADAAFGGRQAILIDLPGYGYSERPASFSYRTGDQAQVVIELLDNLGLDAFWLYGHSMGGSIAIEVAARLAQRVKGLAVSEPNFYPGGGVYSREIAAQDEADFITCGYASLLAQEKSAWAGSLQSSAPWALWRGAKSLVDGIEPSWMELFANFTPPKTLIFGALSLPDKDAECVQRQGISLRIIPDAGHAMSEERPGLLAQALNDFITEHE